MTELCSKLAKEMGGGPETYATLKLERMVKEIK